MQPLGEDQRSSSFVAPIEEPLGRVHPMARFHNPCTYSMTTSLLGHSVAISLKRRERITRRTHNTSQTSLNETHMTLCHALPRDYQQSVTAAKVDKNAPNNRPSIMAVWGKFEFTTRTRQKPFVLKLIPTAFMGKCCPSSHRQCRERRFPQSERES